MKYIKEYLETVVKIKPLGELTTKDDELNGMSGEMVYIDGKCSDIFISHADYANWLERKYEQKSIDNLTPQEVMDIAVAKCFEQGKQKPADKVKPKFRVGDWVVYNRDDYSREVIQVYDIRDGRYYFNDNIHFSWSIKECDEKSHLWSIEDAKDGDILVSQHNQPFIYNGNYNDYKVGAYCGIEYTGEQFIDTYAEICWTDNKFIKPATKEQRGILFSKMHDSGYEWDSEKKELKKIEDEEYNGEDYGIDSLYHAQRILEKTLGKVEGYQTDDGILSHQCAITAVKKLYEQKPTEWSQEAEKQGEQKTVVTNFSDLTTWKYIVDAVLTKEHGVGNYLDDPNTEKFAKELQERFGSVEQKPTECIKFSNEFENQISHLLVSVLNGEHEYNEGFVKYVAQSLLGYAKNELKPTGWSEEDEHWRQKVIDFMKHPDLIKATPTLAKDTIDWLKSLKQRIGG